MIQEPIVRGTIISFSPAEGKCFGFIQPDGTDKREDNVYFRLTFQHTFLLDGDDYVKHGPPWVQMPATGDRVVFEPEPCWKGFRARWWGFEASYDEAIGFIKNRPTYRFVNRIGKIPLSRLQERPVISVKWCGKCLPALRTKFPKALYPFQQYELYSWHFEKFNPESERWEICEDPR
jgi:hypothetical protein